MQVGILRSGSLLAMGGPPDGTLAGGDRAAGSIPAASRRAAGGQSSLEVAACPLLGVMAGGSLAVGLPLITALLPRRSCATARVGPH
jgi:hypothetical protein